LGRSDDGLSNADHYRGFAAGPVSGARILFQESAPGNLDKLDVLLRQHAGTDPDSLDLAAQEALLDKALVYDAEGREMLRDLTSRRWLGEQERDIQADPRCAVGELSPTLAGPLSAVPARTPVSEI
jgi:hypothetical protein